MNLREIFGRLKDNLHLRLYATRAAEKETQLRNLQERITYFSSLPNTEDTVWMLRGTYDRELRAYHEIGQRAKYDELREWRLKDEDHLWEKSGYVRDMSGGIVVYRRKNDGK